MDKFFVDIRSILTTTPARWHRLAEALPEELVQRPPKLGEWSALECLVHILDTEAVFNFRLGCFLRGEDFPDFNPDSEGSPAEGKSTKDLAGELDRQRQESLKALETLSPADLERTARHAELGPVTLRQMLNEWAAHDLMHTVQAERAVMQPFIQGSGAWQVYFQDHLVE